MKTTPNKKYDKSGKVLVKIRTKLEVTQNAFAKQVATTSQYLSQCERGLAFLSKRSLTKLQGISPNGASDLLQAYVQDKTETAQQKVNKLKKAIRK